MWYPGDERIGRFASEGRGGEGTLNPCDAVLFAAVPGFTPLLTPSLPPGEGRGEGISHEDRWLPSPGGGESLIRGESSANAKTCPDGAGFYPLFSYAQR